ncbi:hypothetical protein H0H92_000524 [Tricholoma furcatifolium]|nr:hypothetical protein H0H92_000524 [Tricholoma furcatifolium]
MSILGLVGGLGICIVSWVAVGQLWKHPLTKPETVGLWMHAALFTLLTLLSLFGIASGVYTLWALFHENSWVVIANCLSGESDPATDSICKQGIGFYRGVAVAAYVIIWLLMIYAYVIVDNYVEQLDDEASVKETRQMINSISQPRVTVAPVVVPAYASYPSMQAPPGSAYAFSHPQQSYGARGNNSMV